MTKKTSRPLTTIEGHLERITYFNPDNHYTVASLKTHQTQNRVTVVGFMATISPGETLKIRGTWESHPRYGHQFKIDSYSIILPDTTDDIRKYLASGIIKGIGPVMALRLVNYFGSKTLEIIEQHPEKLFEVEGIGKAKAAIITGAWQEHHVIRRLMQFLQVVGVKTSFCAKIIKEYGGDAIEVIRKDPYRLASDVLGISFYIADAVAQKLGKTKNEPERTRACVRYI
ncbi:helix-hairpin-helix domain-containing protein, partial [Thermodesulfobacteriota bacterium]